MTVYEMQTHFHPQSTGTVAATNENLSPSGDLVNDNIISTTTNGNGNITNAFSNDASHSTLSSTTCSDYCDSSNPSTNVDDIVSKDMVVTSAAGDATAATSRAAMPLMGTDTQSQVSCPTSMNSISRDQVLQNHQVQQLSQQSPNQSNQQATPQQPTSLPHVHSQSIQSSQQNQQMHSNTSQSQLISQQQHFQHHSDHHQSMQQARQHQDLQQGQNLNQTGQLPSFAEITGGNIGSPSQFMGNPSDMLCPLDMDSKNSFRSMSHLQNQHQQPNVHSQGNSLHNMQLPVNTFANVSQSSSLSPSSTSVANQQALTSLMKEMKLSTDPTSVSTSGQNTGSPGQYHGMQNTAVNGFFGRTPADPLNSFFPNDGLGRSMDKPDAKLAATSVLWSNTGADIGSGNMTAPGLQGVGFPSSNCTNNNTSFFNAAGEVGMPSQQSGGPPHSHHQQAQYAQYAIPGSKRAITGGHNLMTGHHGGRSAGSTQFGGSGSMMSSGGSGAGRHFPGSGGHTGGSRNYSGSNIWTLALQNQRMGNPPAPMNVIGAALNVQGANSNTTNSASNSGHGGRSGSGASYPNMFSKRHRPLPPHKQYELTNAVAATATNPSCIEPSFPELSPAGGPHNSLSGLTTPDGGPTSSKGFESLGKFGPAQHQTPQSQSAVDNVQFYEDLFRGAGFDGHTAANFMNTNFMNTGGSFEGDMTTSHIPSAAATIPGYLNPGLMPNNMSGGPPQAREERYSRKVFVGGLPPDIDEEEITNAFRRFGPLVVDWPHKAESKTFFPPKGYCFLLFQDEMSVQHLIEACVVEDQKYYWCVSSPTMKDKAVQIRPWNLADSDYVMDGSQPLDPRKTIFVGGVPRPLRALELAMIMDRLYGGVCYAGIDTDPELKYPKGAGRVAFSNQQSYIAAISARFVQLQHNDIDKRVEVKPYVLDDQMCDECQGSRCQGKFAPFFCANVMCLQYYCEQCWAHIHSRPGREFHKPLVKEGADRPRTMNFRW